jgi:UDP-glucose 4-epimerase
VRVVVTGGRGFIGSHIVDALVERGDEVFVFDMEVSGDNENPGASYFKFALDRTWTELLQGVSAVFHCAAIARTPWCIEDPVLAWETNTLGSVRLLEACRKAQVPRVVLSSSNVVYNPGNPYAASKTAMEEAAAVYTKLYDLSTVCLRYANTYGPRQREDGIGPNVFPALRKSLREDGFIRISGNGEQSRQFIHVSDVVRANLLAAVQDVTGNFDICTGTNTSMLEIARMLKAPIQHVPEREGDIKHIRQDPVPAIEQLGFVSTVKLYDGIWDCFDREKVAV